MLRGFLFFFLCVFMCGFMCELPVFLKNGIASEMGFSHDFFKKSSSFLKTPFKFRNKVRNQLFLKKWCQEVQKVFLKNKWGEWFCPKKALRVFGLTTFHHPLIYATFGNPQSRNRTLLFSMVHGDENTPFYLGMKLLTWLAQRERFWKEKTFIVLAPLVNPDGFFHTPKTRYNGQGIDLNRNFPTTDWQQKALLFWRAKYRSDRRRFPGWQGGSEKETIFQMELIAHFQPQKILSIHAPLNMMDYDGPAVLSLFRFPKWYLNRCSKLQKRLQARSAGFFPGSLGNYAGYERGIPTMTLELPTALARYASRYWKTFQKGIETLISFSMSKEQRKAVNQDP